MRHIYLIIGLLLTLLFPSITNAQNNSEALALLKQPGHHAIIRHALAPGMGDPDNITLGDCATQRNLDAAGRAQPKVLGDMFRAAGLTDATLLSSPWCRTMDTAQLMDLGPVTAADELSSVWTRSASYAQDKTRSLKTLLENTPPDQTLVMITHSVNISALTGRGASSGHGYVIKLDDGEVKVVGAFGAN